MILHTFFPIASAFLLSVVNGQVLRNITVDDTDPAITYTGTWNKGSGHSDSYGGAHRWVNQSGPYATFIFTGVAVYYLMPLFEGYAGGVSTLLTLDSRPAQLVNLTRVGSEPTASAVRWSATGLTSGTHTVVISLGVSPQGDLANRGEVDAFIYTAEDPSSASFNAPNPTTPANTPIRLASTNTQPLTSLGECAPCGKSKCSFSPVEPQIRDTYLLVVGKPVSNCGTGNSETVTSQYTTEMEVTETWSVDASIGVSYGGLNIEAGAGWSKAASVRASQQVSMSIRPGKMAALIANVSYKKTSGSMHIGSAVWDFSSIQPTGITGYSVEYADCGNLFSAFTLSSSNCTSKSTTYTTTCTSVLGMDICISKSAAYTNRCSPLFMGLVGITVLWMI